MSQHLHRTGDSDEWGAPTRRQFMTSLAAAGVAGGLLGACAAEDSDTAEAGELGNARQLDGAGVYMFNLSATQISQLDVNNRPVTGGIGGWSTSPGAEYQPRSAAVPRSRAQPFELSEAAFSQDSPNSLSIEWEGGFRTTVVTVDIREDPGMREDLLLYLSPDQAVLFDVFGKLIDTFFEGA